MEHQALQVTTARQELLGKMVFLAPMGSQVLLVPKAYLGNWALMEIMGFLVLQAIPDLQAKKDTREKKVPRVHVAPRASRVRRVHKVLEAPQANQVKLALRERLASQAHLAQLALLV